MEYVFGFGGVINLLSSHNIPDNLSEIGVEYVKVRHSLHCSDCVTTQSKFYMLRMLCYLSEIGVGSFFVAHVTPKCLKRFSTQTKNCRM